MNFKNIQLEKEEKSYKPEIKTRTGYRTQDAVNR